MHTVVVFLDKEEKHNFRQVVWNNSCSNEEFLFER